MIVKRVSIFLALHAEKFMYRHFWLNRFRVARYARRFFTNRAARYKTNFIELEGRKMFLDEGDSLKLSLYPYVVEMTNFFKQNIKKGDVVLDLGAHIGYFTCLFAQLVGESGKVFSFEPAPNNFKLLKKNVEVNGYKHVVIEQKAVSNVNTTVKMYLSNSPKDHRIYDTHDNRESIEVESIRLDDYFKDFNQKISLVKSNIQGADYAAFQGMKSVIEKSKSNIILAMEFNPAMIKGFGSGIAEEFLDQLLAYDFKLYDLRWQEGIFPITRDKMLQLYNEKNKKGGFMLCIPSNLEIKI
jgi:FkbM family methyltransferase